MTQSSAGLWYGTAPHLDKSVLEMLSADEFSLLTTIFRLVVPPVLIEEIIADLTLKPSERRVPGEIVKRLAAKMAEAVGYQPIHYISLAASSLLYGAPVPMFGQVPIGDRPNVYDTPDGRALVYDAVPEQHFWERLAAGQFASDDLERAKRWRESIQQIDLGNIERTWLKRTRDIYGPVRTGSDLVAIVDHFMARPENAAQEELTRTCAALVGFDNSGEAAVLERWTRANRPLLRDFAPYAAYIMRLVS